MLHDDVGNIITVMITAIKMVITTVMVIKLAMISLIMIDDDIDNCNAW